MQRIGADISSDKFWDERSAAYAAEMALPYHKHRLSVVRAMLPELSGKFVLDFGCGDGVMMAEATSHGAKSLGIEPNETLAEIAARHGNVLIGSVEKFDGLEDNSLDIVLCLNVIAYLDNAEEQTFYREVRRTLKPGGTLLITHSNALFDVFTLNSYTVDFFKREFACDPTPLLSSPKKPQQSTYNIRENPLAYSTKLASLSFQEDRQEFINYHDAPPMLRSDVNYLDLSRTQLDTLNWPADERWKLQFQCSTFASRSLKIG